MASFGGPLVPSKEESSMLPGSSPSARYSLHGSVVLHKYIIVVVVVCTCL